MGTPIKSFVEVIYERYHISMPTSPFSSHLPELVETRVDPLLSMASGTGGTHVGGSYTLRGNMHYILHTYYHHPGRVTKSIVIHKSGVAFSPNILLPVKTLLRTDVH